MGAFHIQIVETTEVSLLCETQLPHLKSTGRFFWLILTSARNINTGFGTGPEMNSLDFKNTIISCLNFWEALYIRPDRSSRRGRYSLTRSLDLMGNQPTGNDRIKILIGIILHNHNRMLN